MGLEKCHILPSHSIPYLSVSSVSYVHLCIYWSTVALQFIEVIGVLVSSAHQSEPDI